MNLTNFEGIPLSAALAAAISKIVAEPGEKMKLMPKTHNPYWRVHLEFTLEAMADGSVVKLLPVPDGNVYANLELGADVLGEGGVQCLKDGLGEGVLHLSGPTGLSDAAVEGEAQTVFGDGELDLDHGTGSITQEPGAEN